MNCANACMFLQVAYIYTHGLDMPSTSHAASKMAENCRLLHVESGLQRIWASQSAGRLLAQYSFCCDLVDDTITPWLLTPQVGAMTVE
jgi:hypothetical protein